jgi:hypothetical protein
MNNWATRFEYFFKLYFFFGNTTLKGGGATSPLKKGFVHEAKLKNSFVHSTKPEKDFDFWNKMVWYGTLVFQCIERLDVSIQAREQLLKEKN